MTEVRYLLQRDTDVPGTLDWLSPAEQEVRSRFTRPKRRADWTLGRWTAKRLAAAWRGLPVKAVEEPLAEPHPDL